MDKRVNTLVKLKNSLYNIKEFPKYIKEGIGRAIGYALVLSLLCGLVTGIASAFNINKSINNTVETLREDKYKFSIKEGILDLESSPARLDENGILIYIDDNISLDKSSDLRNITAHSNSYILLLKDGIEMVSDMMPRVSASYKDVFGDGNINTDILVNNIEGASKYVLMLFAIINIFQTFITFLINSVFIAVLSMLTNYLLGLRMRFSTLFSLVVYCSTLPTVIVTILTAINPVVYFETAGMVGSLLLTLFVLRGIRKEIDENVNIQ